MFKTAYVWFKNLTAAGRAGVVIASLVGFSAVGAATNNAQQPTNTSKKPSTVQQTSQITHKTLVVTEPIAYRTVEQNDSSLAKGTKKVVTVGKNGVQTITYKVTYTNGVETSRTKTTSEVTTQPVDEVIAIGTYEAPSLDCPNGTYTNSYGNTVCRPYESSTAPAGATAKCYDGTYSFSQHRSGTCSHHGGVQEWL